MNWDWCDAVWICTTDKNIKSEKYKKTLQTLDWLQVPKKKIHNNIMKHGSHATPEHSCSANHVKVWNRAFDMGQNRVFIVEDDIIPAPLVNLKKANNALQDFIQENKEEWDILYLGCFAQEMEKDIHRYRFRRSLCWACHAYIVNNKFLQRYKKYTPNQMTQEGHELLQTQGTKQDQMLQNLSPLLNIDGWLVMLQRCGELNSFSIYPQILSQSSKPFTNVYTFTFEPLTALTGNAIYSLIFAILFVSCLVIFGVAMIGTWKRQKRYIK